jgi:hypothetical protein
MAKVYTGRDGRLLIDDIEQIKVSNWTLTGSLEMLETTTLGDYQRTYVPGVQEFNGSATILYYQTDEDRNDAELAIRKVLRTLGVRDEQSVDLRFRFVENDITRDVRFTAYITSFTLGASVGEVSSAQITFQCVGAATEVTL